MKIAVLSDIHANYRALEAVADQVERWQPDQVLVAGDIVNRGPRSACCWQFVQEKQQLAGWQVIRGNHENYVISRAEIAEPETDPLYAMLQPIYFAYRQLDGRIPSLAALPEQIDLALAGAGKFRLVHASMLGDRIGIYPETSAAEMERLIAPAPAVLAVGHTHRALTRRLKQSLVVNVGSVGLPFDGDQRASYAQITWDGERWQAEIARVAYDLEAAEKDYDLFGFRQGGGPLVELILLELKTALSQLYLWVEKYNQAVQRGEISVEAATRQFLEAPVTKPYW